MQDSITCHNDEVNIDNPFYFVYLDQQFQFDLALFEHNSNVIKQMHDKIVADKKIPLISSKEKVDISKGSIEEFIKCCHFQNFVINNENVYSLRYLANKYKVSFFKKNKLKNLFPKTKIILYSMIFKISPVKKKK